jgi:hypothetical protein
LTSGQLLTTVHLEIYDCVYSFINNDTVGYVGFKLWKRNASGIETLILDDGAGNPITIGSMNKGASAGTRQVNVAVPLTSLNPTDTIVIRYYARSTTSSWHILMLEWGGDYAEAVFSTPQLNAQDYGGNTETFRAFMQVTGISGRIDIFLMIGYYTTVATGILNFQYTIATKTWHNVSTWTFQLLTRKWNNINTFALTLQTRTWQNIASWTFNLITQTWHETTSWIFQLQTQKWHEITSWIFQLATKKWYEIALWNFQTLTRKWNSIAYWTWQTITYGWHTITEWTFSLISQGWHEVIIWIFTIETTIKKAFPFIILVGGIIVIAISIFILFKH